MAFDDQKQALRKVEAGRMIYLESIVDGYVYDYKDDGQDDRTGEHSASRQNIVLALDKVCLVGEERFPLYRLAKEPTRSDSVFDNRYLKHNGKWEFATPEWKAQQAIRIAKRNGDTKQHDAIAAKIIADADANAKGKQAKSTLGVA